jgi:hypothetical protein
MARSENPTDTSPFPYLGSIPFCPDLEESLGKPTELAKGMFAASIAKMVNRFF